MTAGVSRAATTITRQPALAPSPQPRPAPTGRALIAQNVRRGGPFWTPIRGPDRMPTDTAAPLARRQPGDRAPLIMEVNPSIPVKTVPEFIAYAKANPVRLNVASAATPVHSLVAINRNAWSQSIGISG